jgi:hypothetical protein
MRMPCCSMLCTLWWVPCKTSKARFFPEWARAPLCVYQVNFTSIQSTPHKTHPGETATMQTVPPHTVHHTHVPLALKLTRQLASPSASADRLTSLHHATSELLSPLSAGRSDTLALAAGCRCTCSTSARQHTLGLTAERQPYTRLLVLCQAKKGFGSSSAKSKVLVCGALAGYRSRASTHWSLRSYGEQWITEEVCAVAHCSLCTGSAGPQEQSAAKGRRPGLDTRRVALRLSGAARSVALSPW